VPAQNLQFQLIECEGYYARVERARDGMLYGRVIGLEEIINFKAVTQRLVERQFTRALEAYFERCRQKGIKPDKPRAFSV
jgi:predicted HicB family RNase H-like nuclease